MQYLYLSGQTCNIKHSPIVVITQNNYLELLPQVELREKFLLYRPPTGKSLSVC